jgi:Tol biopolymer transport system component
MPDSRSVIYTFEDPVYDLHRLTIDASIPDTVVLATSFDKRAGGISPDGRTLVYAENVDRDRLMLLALPGGAPRPVDTQQGSQRNAVFSPDGRWIAYDEAALNAEPQVYVRALDGHAGRILVSAEGGNQPRWTKGGREIVYRRGNAMLAVPFDPITAKAGSPAVLFRKSDAGQLDHRTAGYDVTPDGSRFLLVVPIARPEAQPTHVILNWTGTLQQKVPQ